MSDRVCRIAEHASGWASTVVEVFSATFTTRNEGAAAA
jgi:hypothetical protein